MRYLAVDFIISAQVDLRQTVSDLLASEAGEIGFESFVESETGLQGYIQENLFDKTELDEAISRIPIEAHISYTINKMEDKDWNQTWEEAGFEPIHIGKSCIIYDARHTNKEAIDCAPGKLNLFIETKQAFGTGTHQTTQMMLGNIMKHVKDGMDVLDFGCGTGILGIAASKYGAKNVLGYDIDAWSVDNAKHNAELNGVSNMEVLLGDTQVLIGMERKFDVILANINRNIIVADLPTLKMVMKPKALLLTSGFYQKDIEEVTHKAQKEGLMELHREILDDWSCVVYQLH